jgi:hypothetical protein
VWHLFEPTYERDETVEILVDTSVFAAGFVMELLGLFSKDANLQQLDGASSFCSLRDDQTQQNSMLPAIASRQHTQIRVAKLAFSL